MKKVRTALRPSHPPFQTISQTSDSGHFLKYYMLYSWQLCLALQPAFLFIAAANIPEWRDRAASAATKNAIPNYARRSMSSYLANGYTDITPRGTEHDKRLLNYIRATRSLVVDYTCPVSGPQTRAFRWQAEHHLVGGTLRMSGLLNILSWDHLTVVTNNFMTHFHAKRCESHGEYCCLHLYTAAVLGTVFPDHIMMWVGVPQHDPRNAIYISEICAYIHDAAGCPVVANTGHQDCQVTNVALAPQ